MPLTPGASFGGYEIVARLGAGGMGEVYRARDPRLEREVALKVLPAAMVADDDARARLLREARMAARLNHPHVCTIHEVGEAEGQAYVAMELVPGQALSERLASGRMGVEEVLRLGQQMADALAHAHDNGVVHRDFKSANVIVTPEGRAKVLDFGLAKPLAETESEATTLTGAPLTAQGAVVGTLAYMAPEQLKGRRADARSDVWALGVVLYEMASGARPFAGQDRVRALLGDPQPCAPAAAGGRATAPGRGHRALSGEGARRSGTRGRGRCARRWRRCGQGRVPTAGWRPALPARRRWALLAGLATVVVVVAIAAVLDVGGLRRRLLGRAGGPGAAIRLAVLPFANLTGDPEQEYLSDGLTQELIAQLGRLHPGGLSVIARTSVMRYKKSDTPIDQIGRELGVDYVLEGSARREGARIRITTELVHVRDQAQLWAETYERELSGTPRAPERGRGDGGQGAGAQAAAGRAGPRWPRPATVDPEAHDAYLKGSYHWKKLTPADLDTAQRYFELALSRDPSYAPAYEGLAIVWSARQQGGSFGPRRPGPRRRRRRFGPSRWTTAPRRPTKPWRWSEPGSTGIGKGPSPSGGAPSSSTPTPLTRTRTTRTSSRSWGASTTPCRTAAGPSSWTPSTRCSTACTP